jgi:hypothetical protein
MKEVALALRWGLKMAVVYSLFAVAVRILAGDAPFESAGTAVWKVVVAYFAGGIAAGMIAGLLLPLGRYWVGAMLVGAVAGMPVMFAIGMAIRPPDEWLTVVPKIAVGGALLLGPACGLSAWFIHRRLSRGGL